MARVAGLAAVFSLGVSWLVYTRRRAPTCKAQYCLVVSDLDGTLLDDAHGVTKDNKTALQNLYDAGVKICLASGRMVTAMTPIEQHLGMDLNLVCYNGACAVGPRQDGRTALFHQPLVRRS